MEGLIIILYFISGIFFIQTVLPILDGLTNWFLSYIELKKAKLAVSITQFNKQIQQANEKKPNQIGFVIEDEVDEYDEQLL